MSKIKRYLLIFFPLLCFSINSSYAYTRYGDQGTPAYIALKHIFKNSYFGISTGVKFIPVEHTIKGNVAHCIVVDGKKIYIYVPGEKPRTPPSTGGTPPPPQDPKSLRLFYFQWPYDSYLQLDTNPKDKIGKYILDEAKKRDKENDDKNPDTVISTSMLGFPIRCSYMYEFESSKFRFSFDPCIFFVRVSDYKLKSVPDPKDKNATAQDYGRVVPDQRWSSFLEIPFAVYYKFVNTKYIDVFLCAIAGLQFSNYKLSDKQAFVYKFWDLGLMFEIANRQNIKPYIKISVSKGSMPDPRIKSKKIVGAASSYFTIEVQTGLRFRLLPKKVRCGIPNCLIKQHHVHGRKNYRGRSYFADRR